MSVKTVTICDFCEKEFKTEHSGGKTEDFVMDIFYYPVTHFKLTDTRGDNYDFCSLECLGSKVVK